MANEAKNSGARYRIDAVHSEFTVQAFAEGLLSFVGHNPTFAVRKFGGEIQFAADETKVDSLLLIVQSNSLGLLDDVSDKDAIEIEQTTDDKVLETKRFPEITFVSKDVSLERISNNQFNVRANGFLSLHGETRRQMIEAEAEINAENIRAVGDFKLSQSDFNIERIKSLGGTLKVKDEVEISFDITAEKVRTER